MTEIVRKGLAIAGLLTFVGFTNGCTAQKTQVGAQPVLQVNDHVLTAQEFSDRLARRLKQFDALTAKDPATLMRTKEEVLRNYTLEALIMDDAKNHKVTVSDEELDAEVNSFRSAYPDDVSFRRELALENQSLTSWRESLRTTLLERKVFAQINQKVATPGDEEIKKYFEENKDKFRRKERIYLRQILVDNLTKATELKEELDKKKSNFNELATKYSLAP
jgi:peptidyl-prolyl cis-trans isomerase C